MRVLYIGVYRDGTGWGQAAIDYILALDAAGIDVVPRPLKLNDRDHRPPGRILELEKKTPQGCDVCIQHVLPHQMDYNGRFRRNIGLFASETSDFAPSSWADRLNLMDEVWVINYAQKQAAQKSGVTVPIHVVPHATDVTRFQRSYEPLPQLAGFRDAGMFAFYTLGEMVRRKNLAATLKAFHTEFDPSEPVSLVIQTSIPGQSPAQTGQGVRGFCDEIKRGLKLNGGDTKRYAQELILAERLSDLDILRLHASCDCFVQPSFGESWSIPAFDAMAMGRTPIVTACTGYLDWMTPQTGWLVPGHEEPVFGALETFADVHTGAETWCAVDVLALRRALREAYTKDSLRQEKSAHGIQRAYDFSYENVGALMKELLAHEPIPARPLAHRPTGSPGPDAGGQAS
jgi:glycosyltransferase involved in cell wall biosynthesis